MAMPNNNMARSNYNGNGTTAKVGGPKLMSAPPSLPKIPSSLPQVKSGLPENLRQVVDRVKKATKASEASKKAAKAETKKIPALQTETDPRRAKVWITRLTEELGCASDLMRALWEIDPERKIQRIRALRRITQLNLKESKIVIDAVNTLIPTTSTDALETALMVAKQRDDLKHGLEEAQADIHFHREELKEEVCDEIKEELQKRLQKKLSQFSALKNENKQHRERYNGQKAEIVRLSGALEQAEQAFEEETEQGELAEQRINELRDELGEMDNLFSSERETWEAKKEEFLQMWNVIQFHYKEHMPHDKVFASLLFAMGQMVGADVLEW